MQRTPTIHTWQEGEALEAFKVALHALDEAIQKAELAGYGSLVLGGLQDARRELVYAFDVARGLL